MALLRAAGIAACALACAVVFLVPAAFASTAPIVRLAGTGTSDVYLDPPNKTGAQDALGVTFAYAGGVSAEYGTGGHSVYLADLDYRDNRIFKIDGSTMRLIVGNGDYGGDSDGTPATSHGSTSPTGVASYGIGGLLFTEHFELGSQGSLRSYTSLSTTLATLIPFGSSLSHPADLSTDPGGDGYIADGLLAKTTSGTIVVGTTNSDDPNPTPSDPKSGSIGGISDVGLVDLSTGTFIAVSTRGAWLVEHAGTAEDQITQLLTASTLLDPSSVAVMADGGYLVYDAGSHVIRRVSDTGPDPAVTTVAGNGASGLATPGTPANQAPLADDGDLAITRDGLVVSQGRTGVVEMIPATAITDGPPALSNSSSASFTLESWDDEATYACRLDGAAPVTCTSGQPFSGLADGDHSMSIAATTDGGTLIDDLPSTRTWTVDATAPANFDLIAPADGASGDATFTWQPTTDAGPGEVRYELWIDGAKAADASPVCDAAMCSAALPKLVDGNHSWQVKAFDEAGNVKPSAARTLVVNRPPTASLVIAPTPALVGRTVTFDASKSTDSNGTIVRYEWDLDGDGSFETTTTEPLTTRSYPAPRSFTAAVRVVDNDDHGVIASGSVVVTAQPPPGKQLGVSINDGAQYTNDPKVTVFAVWPTFASDALVSNDGGFKKAELFPVTEKIPWTLDSTGPERLPKTIYVRFTAGTRVSETYQDDIILDQTPPQVLAASIAAKAATARAAAAKVTLKLKAKDNVSGVGKAQVTKNKRKPGRLLKFKTKLKVAAAKKLYVRVRDRAGNFSAWRTVKRR